MAGLWVVRAVLALAVAGAGPPGHAGEGVPASGEVATFALEKVPIFANVLEDRVAGNSS